MRAKQWRSFTVVGMDNAGPIYCADHPGKKFYFLLYTCASTRVIHLELVNSLTAEYCVAAIRRFLARRGLPSVLWSDNAKTFVAARQKLNQLLVDLCPRWNYIALWSLVVGRLVSQV